MEIVMKILAIGASGSLGHSYSNYSTYKESITKTFNRRPLDSINAIKLDITNKSDFDHLESDYDAIILFAAAMPAEMEGYSPQKYIDVNVTGALNVLEFARRNSINKIIYIQTFSDMSAYFYNGIPIQDDAPRTINYTGDHAVYAISKIAAAELFEHYHQEYGMQTIIFRIPTVYCNDENIDYCVDGVNKRKSYIAMIESIINNNRVEIWGNPNNSKDMPYIKDFVRLLDKAVGHPSAQGTFNAGTGQPVSLQKLVDSMVNVFSPTPDNVDIVSRTDEQSQPNFTFDMSKTNSTFNYKPEYDCENMLEDIKNSLLPELLKLNDVNE